MATSLISTPTSALGYITSPDLPSTSKTSTVATLPSVLTTAPAIKNIATQTQAVKSMSSAVANQSAANRSVPAQPAAPVAQKTSTVATAPKTAGPVATPAQFANDAYSSATNPQGLTVAQMSAMAGGTPPPITGGIATGTTNANGSATINTSPASNTGAQPSQTPSPSTAAPTQAAWGRTGTYVNGAGQSVYDEQTWNPLLGKYETVTYDAKTGAKYTGAPVQAQTQYGTSDAYGNATFNAPSSTSSSATGANGLPFQSQIDSLQTQTDALHAQYMTDLEKLRNGTIPLTESQQGQLDTIKMQFDQLMQQQKIANENYTQGVSIAGIVAGRDKYTPETEMGNIKRTVDQGISKLAEINATALKTLYDAKTAMQSENWKALDTAYAKLDSFMQQKQATLDKLQERTLDQANKLAERNRQTAQDKLNYSTTTAPGIAGSLTYLKSDGTIHQPTEADIQAEAAKSGIDVGILRASVYEQMSKLRDTQTAKKAAEEVQLNKDKNSLIASAVQNSAPQSVIAAINSAKTYADAANAGGQYLSSATGIIGEYNFYKRQEEAAGRTPVSFTEYQDMDVNRKKLASTISDASGLTPSQNANFVRISDKYQADQVINAGDRAVQANALADQVIANPGNAGLQLQILYTLVKNLDPNSAVREGEIALATNTQSYLSKFGLSLEKIGSGKIIGNDAAIELAQATKNLSASWQDAAARREMKYKAQADTANIGDAFNTYLKSSKELPSTADFIRSMQQSAEDYLTNNPEEAQKVQDLQKNMGWTDAQAIEYVNSQYLGGGNSSTKGFSPVSGDTNAATIPVSGEKPVPVAVASEAIRSVKPAGEWGGQCGAFVHSVVADYPYGLDGINKKESVINVPKTSIPRVGDVVIQRIGGQYGHVAIVNSVDPKSETITLTESNYYDKTRPEEVTHNRKLSLSSPTISGYFRGQLTNKIIA